MEIKEINNQSKEFIRIISYKTRAPTQKISVVATTVKSAQTSQEFNSRMIKIGKTKIT